MREFSPVAASRGYSLVAVRGLLIAAASRCRAWALGEWVLVAPGPSGSAAYAVFPDQGSNQVSCTGGWVLIHLPPGKFSIFIS